jgi:A/G-specific adenine glycosylase
MPWRDDPTPYKVLVSELMLQQTQVSRVVPKFDAFMYTCTNMAELAARPLSTVLELWSGLGYNRRAKYLHQAAQAVVRDYAGQLPASFNQLVKLPGIGPNTAGAILAYAYNQPVVYVETNIRTVYIHHFFADQDTVDDSQIRELVAATLDHDNPREWYWALMDYGSHLKRSGVRTVSRSRHYKRQSPLAGSVREMRGRILKQLIKGAATTEQLQQRVVADERYETALAGLVHDGLIEHRGNKLGLTGASDGSILESA